MALSQPQVNPDISGGRRTLAGADLKRWQDIRNSLNEIFGDYSDINFLSVNQTITGQKTFNNAVYMNYGLTATDDVTVTDSELMLNYTAGYDGGLPNTWTFKQDPGSGGVLSIRPSNEASNFSIIDFFSALGDGSQLTYLNIFGDGATHLGTDGEFLQIGWTGASEYYHIKTLKRSGGAQRELRLSADGSTDQLVLETGSGSGGDVSIANNLDVGGDVDATSFNTGQMDLTATELYYGGGSNFDMRAAVGFRFRDDILMENGEQIRFRDTNAVIYSTGVGDLLIDVRDEVQIDTITLDINATTTDISGEIEINGDLNHDGSNVGFYGTTPVTRAAHIVDADGTLADITTKFNTLLTYLESTTGIGIMANA